MLRKKTATLGFMLMIILSLFMAGCSTTSQVDQSKETAAKDLPPLKVASTPTGPPFTFLNEENKKMEGIMIDIITALGQEIGRKVEIEPTAWASLIPSLQGKKVDLIAAGMYITDERKQVVDFTDSVFGFGEGLVVSKDNNDIKGLEDMKGKILGVQTGTTYVDKLSKVVQFKEVKTYKSVGDMIMEMQNKRIDGFVADAPIAAYLIKKDPQFQVKLVDSYKPTVSGNVGIGVNKDDTKLKDDLNKAIKTLKDKGEIKKILDKWGIQG
ncbi:MAG: substrate-binding periplasmic protein [Desulfitobacteriaceae bacterium]